MDLASGRSRLKDSSYYLMFTSLPEVILATYVLTLENFYFKQFEVVVDRLFQRKGGYKIFLSTDTKEPSDTSRSDTKQSTQYQEDSLESNASPAFSVFSLNQTFSTRRTTIFDIVSVRINTKTKIYIVDREIEDNKITTEKLNKKFKSAAFLLKTEEENLRADVDEIEKMKSLLSVFVTKNTNKKSGLISYNKFSKFLDDELENKSFMVNKMRMQKRTLEIEYNRIKKQQQLKLELGEHLHQIDIDKLDIEHESRKEMLEQRTNHLNNLKKAIVRKGQTVISIKSKLNETIAALKNIKQDRVVKETKIALIEKKEIQDENKLQTAELSYVNIKRLRDNYKCADVSEYMKTEAALSEAKKEKAHWEKRFLNSRQTVMYLDNQARNLTPSSISLRKTKSAVSKLRTPAKLSGYF